MSTITFLTHHRATATLPTLLESADERELDRRLHRALRRLRALRRARRTDCGAMRARSTSC